MHGVMSAETFPHEPQKRRADRKLLTKCNLVQPGSRQGHESRHEGERSVDECASFGDIAGQSAVSPPHRQQASVAGSESCRDRNVVPCGFHLGLRRPANAPHHLRAEAGEAHCSVSGACVG